MFYDTPLILTNFNNRRLVDNFLLYKLIVHYGFFEFNKPVDKYWHAFTVCVEF